MRSGFRVSVGMGSFGRSCAVATWLGASMTCAWAGRFDGGTGFVSACGAGAACALYSIEEDKRISERIPFLIVGCIGFSLAGPARVAVKECPLLIGWTDSAMRAFKRRT